ncbi:YlbE-like family protein [Lentibacillus sp. N15]|uniref:YlbE-like family protein n=1 Tax=Lentibacillus songyuanensis TaxID=3136161 RepID=UPI0031BBB502
MQSRLFNYLQSRPDLLHFIRYNPSWYRYLTREPDQLSELEKAAKQFYGKTLPQRFEKLSNQVQMAGMLLQFTDLMKD